MARTKQSRREYYSDEESGSEESESESESQSASESGSEESEEEEVLAAFSTSSARATKGPQQRTASKVSLPQRGAGKAAGKAVKGKGNPKKPVRKEPAKTSKVVVPYVGPVEGVKEVELCTDPDATLERHLEDTEKLLAAFEAVVDKHEPLVEKAVELTIERCNAKKRDAVEAATVAAVQATEMRMEGELREAVMQAVADAKIAAKEAQQVAVSEAVRFAEERALEQQRLAVQQITLAHQRSLGKADDELAAEKAASNFQVAAASAAAAAAAAAALLAREEKDDSKQLDVADPADAATPDEVTPMGLKPEEAAAISNASLQEF